MSLDPDLVDLRLGHPRAAVHRARTREVIEGQSPAGAMSSGFQRGVSSTAADSAVMNPRVHLDGIEFVHAGRIDAVRDDAGIVALDRPHERFANRRQLALDAYGAGPFCRLKVGPLPTSAGVYAVMAPAGLCYLGSSSRTTIRERWGPRGYSVIHPRHCFQGRQTARCWLNGLITAHLHAGGSLDLFVHVTETPDQLLKDLFARSQPAWTRADDT